MDWRFWTIVVMAGAASLVIIWDIVVAVYSRRLSRDTVSGVTLGWSAKWWGLPFVLGALCGHLFIPGVWLFPNPWLGAPLLVGIAGGLTLLGHYAAVRPRGDWFYSLRAFAIINFGLVCGHLLWPQVGG